MLRVRVVLTGLPGSPYLATHYFDGTGSVAAQDAANAVGTMWQGIVANTKSPQDADVEPFVADMDPVTGTVTGGYSITPPNITPALGTGDLLPAGVQGIVTWRTGVYAGGREIKGRMFVPGLQEFASDPNGRMDNGTNAALQGIVNDFLATADEAVIWSRKNGQTAQISNAQVERDFGRLRSRQY